MASDSSMHALVESANAALGQMDYLACEAHCLRALPLARRAEDWPAYQSILLPLQEARRQRCMIAADAVVRLGTASLTGPPATWLEAHSSGCVLLTPPHDPPAARALLAAARARRLHVEVLLADAAPAAGHWTLRSFAGRAATCALPAPPPDWTEHWLASPYPTDTGGRTPADFFIDAMETLGNVLLDQVAAPAGSRARLHDLEECLTVVSDHELLHQHLWQAANSLRLARA